jgi:hypothetical protein
VLDGGPEAILERLGESAVDARLGGGAVRYLGFEAFPSGALPGDEVTLVHYWMADHRVERPYRVFVHFLVDGAHGWIPHGDHSPMPSSDRWPVGRVVRDEHRIRLPDVLPGTSVALRVGLYHDDVRMPVDDAGKQDGHQRIVAGSFPVSGTALALPVYDAPRLSAPPRLDGIVDNREWGMAPWTEPFLPSSGRGMARVSTRARMAWDPGHLYLAFVADDPDIQGTLMRRDQPVYREEAVEVFIDAKGTGRDYVELQVSPNGTQFDAAFEGGPRANMNVGFDARYTVAAKVDGTIGNASDRDESWTTEWSIEVASLPHAGGQIRLGDRWRVNLFRVAKDRVAGAQTPDESAWSPPLMGDFHNLERFGELWFKGGQTEATDE